MGKISKQVAFWLAVMLAVVLIPGLGHTQSKEPIKIGVVSPVSGNYGDQVTGESARHFVFRTPLNKRVPV